ncbi:MAG: hypothetical protein ACJAU1_001142 [Psychromonas sp.]|jgi:hypothetical protein
MPTSPLDKCISEHFFGAINSPQNTIKDKNHLLVACMPKSGSTFLTAILNNFPDFKQAILVPDAGRREQELDRIELIRHDNHHYAAQHHVRYSQPTKVLIEQFNIKPIILVRNIYDAMISLRDHLKNESVIKPMGYVLPDMVNWPNSELEEFIVDIFTPWYFNFFVSWHQYEDKYLITYEDLINDPLKKINDINNHFSLGLSSIELETAIDDANNMFTRKNIGITGRGQELNDYCKTQIDKIAKYYKGVDFSLLGITS